LKKIEIMIVGPASKWSENIRDRFENGDSYTILPAASAEQAIELFQRLAIKAVVMSEDISAEDERKLERIFRFHFPEIVMLKAENISADELKLKIDSALAEQERKMKPQWSPVDDALKNAGLNILMQ
jgi:hypothetical protein